MTHTNIIGEIGSVHDGSFGNAMKLIELASEVGVDTVKFQTHIAEAESLPDAPNPPYFKGEDRIAYFKRTAFSRLQWKDLKNCCSDLGITFLSSPFSIEAVDLLEDVGVQAYKIPSGEVTNLPLLKYLADTGKPIILSSGMSSWLELDAAVEILKNGKSEISILQCTSAYPCPAEKVGLNVLQEMQQRYCLPVGFSDHTNGIAGALAMVALGATIIEKHLTFSRKMYGSDAANASEPSEFKMMVRAIRDIETMLGNSVDKNDVSEFQGMKEIFEKSVVTTKELKAGEQLSPLNISTKKPGTGIPASAFFGLVGKQVNRDIPADQMLQLSDII